LASHARQHIFYSALNRQAEPGSCNPAPTRPVQAIAKATAGPIPAPLCVSEII
jgi:hypothetical protein